MIPRRPKRNKLEKWVAQRRFLPFAWFCLASLCRLRSPRRTLEAALRWVEMALIYHHLPTGEGDTQRLLADSVRRADGLAEQYRTLLPKFSLFEVYAFVLGYRDYCFKSRPGLKAHPLAGAWPAALPDWRPDGRRR